MERFRVSKNAASKNKRTFPKSHKLWEYGYCQNPAVILLNTGFRLPLILDRFFCIQNTEKMVKPGIWYLNSYSSLLSYHFLEAQCTKKTNRVNHSNLGFLWFSCLPAGRSWNTRSNWNTCKTVHLFLSFLFSIDPFHCIAHHQLYFTWYFRALQVFQDYRVTEDSTGRRCAHNNDHDNSSFKCIPHVQSSLNWIFFDVSSSRARQVTQVPKGKRSDKLAFSRSLTFVSEE